MKKALILAVLAIGAVAFTLVAVAALFPRHVLDAALWSRQQRAGLTVRATTAAGHRIVYLEGGTGAPLLLLHGFGGDKDNWTPVARYLTAHFHVIAPDLPGFGGSTRDPAAAYGYGEQVERVEAFVQSLGLREPVHLGGNSMGGGIAGLFAARYPDQVRSLWLLDPAGVTGAQPSELQRSIAQGQNPLVFDGPEGFDRLMALLFVHPPWVPRVLKPALVQAMAAHADFNRKVFQELRGTPLSLETELNGSRIPTLIAWGGQDRLLDVSGAEVLRARMLQAQVAILRNVGHVPMLEVPQATADRYLEFQRALR